MSYLLTREVLDKAAARGIEGLDQLVLAHLARLDNLGGGPAYAAHDRLARRCGISERRVRTALRRLEASGEIERVGVARKGMIEYRVLPYERDDLRDTRHGMPLTRHGVPPTPAQGAAYPGTTCRQLGSSTREGTRESD